MVNNIDCPGQRRRVATPAPWVKLRDNVRPVRAKALLCNQNQSMMSLLPLQGALYGTRLPRVPVPLRVTSALGWVLVGLSGRAFPPIDPNIQSQIQLPIRISRPSGLAWPLPKRPSSLARLLCPFCLFPIVRISLFLRYKEKAVGLYGLTAFDS